MARVPVAATLVANCYMNLHSPLPKSLTHEATKLPLRSLSNDSTTHFRRRVRVLRVYYYIMCSFTKKHQLLHIKTRAARTYVFRELSAYDWCSRANVIHGANSQQVRSARLEIDNTQWNVTCVAQLTVNVSSQTCL